MLQQSAQLITWNTSPRASWSLVFLITHSHDYTDLLSPPGDAHTATSPDTAHPLDRSTRQPHHYPGRLPLPHGNHVDLNRRSQVRRSPELVTKECSDTCSWPGGDISHRPLASRSLSHLYVCAFILTPPLPHIRYSQKALGRQSQPRRLRMKS